MITFIFWIININVTEWEGQTLESIEKLRATLDKEFEYEDKELCTIGFKNVVNMVEDWVKQVEI